MVDNIILFGYFPFFITISIFLSVSCCKKKQTATKRSESPSTPQSPGASPKLKKPSAESPLPATPTQDCLTAESPAEPKVQPKKQSDVKKKTEKEKGKMKKSKLRKKSQRSTRLTFNVSQPEEEAEETDVDESDEENPLLAVRDFFMGDRKKKDKRSSEVIPKGNESKDKSKEKIDDKTTEVDRMKTNETLITQETPEFTGKEKSAEVVQSKFVSPNGSGQGSVYLG